MQTHSADLRSRDRSIPMWRFSYRGSSQVPGCAFGVVAWILSDGRKLTGAARRLPIVDNTVDLVVDDPYEHSISDDQEKCVDD